MIIAVILVAGIAGTSYLLLSKKFSAHSNTGSTSHVTKPDKKSTTSTSEATKTQYLVISQWGIKMPLTNSISDAYDVVATNSTDTVWLSLKSLDGTDCDATQANTQSAYISAIGSLEKVSPTEHDPAGSGTYMSEYPGALVGNYYYAYISETSNKTCASQSALKNIDAAFSAAANGIIASN